MYQSTATDTIDRLRSEASELEQRVSDFAAEAGAAICAVDRDLKGVGDDVADACRDRVGVTGLFDALVSMQRSLARTTHSI